MFTHFYEAKSNYDGVIEQAGCSAFSQQKKDAIICLFKCVNDKCLFTLLAYKKQKPSVI